MNSKTEIITKNETAWMVYEENTLSAPVQWTLIIIAIILGIALLVLLIRLFVQGPSYTKKNRIDGKVVIVTGCNTGIGKETVLELAKRGAKLYMACRDHAKCEAARLEIIEKSKNSNVFNRTLDLSSMDSIKKFAEQFNHEENRLDILINNAGLMGCPKSYTTDGFEYQLGVNHLGHFYLTKLLLDKLKASAPSRVVVVTSFAYLIGKINKDDLMSEKSYEKLGAYAQSKLANILFTKYLAKQLEGTGVTVNCCHPGSVRTEGARHILGNRCIKVLWNSITPLFFKTAKAGAQTQLKLALDPSLENISGCFFFDNINAPVLAKANDLDTMEWLWRESEKYIEQAELKLIQK